MSTRELPYPPHRSSAIDHHSAAASLTYRVTIVWPTAIAHLLVTRRVNEGATVPAPSLISNRPSLRCCLTDVSGYHCMANAIAHLLVTRSVNEGATVHAPSLISNRPSLRCYLTDVSGYYCVANGHCTLIGNPKCQRGSYRTRPIAHLLGQLSAVTSVHPAAYFGRCGLRLKSFQTNDIELAAVIFRFWLERSRR